ncbi:MAG: glycosyltransferase family 1 protein [Ferruginibacter sp.]
MKIGFDAKRAYQNPTGLGHYSRTLISSLARFYPEHEYYLFAPTIKPGFDTSGFNNIQAISPQHFPGRLFKNLWRSNWVKKDLQQQGIELYHGLSHEIPVGIAKTGIKSVVTIHDLIFERYPEQYHPIDRFIYRYKFTYACRHADKIIAVSEQTRQDIIDYYKIPEEKITVCYQSCNPAFAELVTDDKKEAVRQRYNLPPDYFLYVGSIIERKNLLQLCRALTLLDSPLPLVVIGDGGAYKQKVKDYIAENGLTENVIFLSEHAEARSAGFRLSTDFPAIYQLATAMIYPSMFEGFGIPVLEALYSRLPVITSNLSCMPETGGDAALYINPNHPEEIAAAMKRVSTDTELRKQMIEKGMVHAEKFSPKNTAETVMKLYQSL